MIDAAIIQNIEARLHETIHGHHLLTETYPSRIFVLHGQRDYLLKLTRTIPLGKQFANHKRIYDVWVDQKDSLGFRIPKPYLLGPDDDYIVMEYVNGDNLLNQVIQGRDDIVDVYRRTGQSLRQYHTLATQAFRDMAEPLIQYGYLAELRLRRAGRHVVERLEAFSSDSQRVLFKDFTPANIAVTQAGDIYFLDLQDVFYAGPLYYDLSRFMDTTKVFSIVRNPLCLLRGYGRIRQALDAFIQGYGSEIDPEALTRMAYIHRQEQIYIKTTKTWIRGLVLRLLFTVI
jgi:hypothetical protein